MHFDQITTALENVNTTINHAQKKSLRPNISTQLIAVSKTYKDVAILPALQAGQQHFGENRVQEAAQKWPPLRAQFPELKLHLIGPLQSNKIAQALSLFDFIHTIDREKIARGIAREIKKQNKKPGLLVQVNTGCEPQKFGIEPNDVKSFIKFCKEELQLEIEGLMCIPPVDEEAALHFSLLAKLADEAGVQGLSMGMSGDYEKAVRFGASWVRVGTAIFGSRN